MEKGLLEVKKLVQEELEDFGYFDYKEIKFDENWKDEFYYDVTIKTTDGKEKELGFKYDKEDDKIYIRLGEDSYEEVVSYDWRIRYFWMALLKWEV